MNEDDIFLDALQIPSPEARGMYLDEACGGDDALRQSIEQLLRAHERAGSFLLGQPAELRPRERGQVTDAVAYDALAAEGPGDQLGPYRLVRQLGEGGMGTVFLADQEKPVKRQVALKIIKAGLDTRQVFARFEQERQALALMDHPHIAKVLDAGATAAGRPFFVMELVVGVPITQYCDQERLSPRERLELLIPVCQAVQHAHQKGIIHRDLKPSNVLVGLYDGRPLPKVIDFGIAKATGQKLTERTMSTEIGQIVGTLEYMAPEQAELNNIDIDTRVDIYSLGVLLYELLTGSPPFSAAELRRSAFDEMLRIIREVEPLKPSTRLSHTRELPSIAARRKLDPQRLTKAVSGDLDWIVMKCLEKERGRRYETANGIAADLTRYLRDEPVTAGPPSATYRLRKFARRHRMAITTTAVVMLALLAGLTGTSWQAVRAQRAERRAAEEAAVAQAVNDFLQHDLLGLAGASDQVRARLRPDPDLKLTALLDRALVEVDSRFSDQPGVRSEVQHTLAHSLLSIGRYRDAVRLLEQVRAYREKTAGAAAPESLAAANELAKAYQDAGRYQLAVSSGEQTLAARRRVLGPEHPDTLDTMNNLVVSYGSTGQLDKALALGEQTLACARRTSGPRHPQTLSVLGTLAETYRLAGEFQKALALHEQALELARAIYSPGHPEIVTSINNVGIALEQCGRHEQARQLLETALDQARNVLGPEHPDTLLAMNNLAGICREGGQLDKALTLHEEALPLMRKVLGPEHPDTVLASGSYALTLAAAGQNDKAIELQEQVLAIRQRMLGAEHPQTLLSLDNLAHAYGSAGRFDKALPLHERSVELSRTILGPDHPDTLRAMMNLGYVYWHTRQFDRSIKVLEDVRRLQAAALPAGHPEICWNEAHLGRAYRDAGRVAEAVPLLEDAYQKAGTQPGLDWVGDELLTTYARAGQKLEAATLAHELLTRIRRDVPPDSPQRASALVRTAQSLLEAQAWDAAEPVLREALAVRQQQTPQDWRTFNTQSMLGEALLGQARLADAEPLLVSAYEGLLQREDQIPAEMRARLSDAQQRIVRLYEAWNKPAEAARWQSRRSSHPSSDSAE